MSQEIMKQFMETGVVNAEQAGLLLATKVKDATLTGSVKMVTREVVVDPSENYLNLLKHTLEVADEYGNSTDGLDEAELKDMAEYLFVARIAWINKLRLEGIHPKDVLYPTIMYVPLRQLAIVQKPMLGYEIIPKLSDAMKTKWLSKDGKSVKPFAAYDKVIKGLRRAGVLISKALPLEKISDDPRFYQLSVEEGRVVGTPGDAPAESVLAARILAQFDTLKDIFGLHAVEYALLKVAEKMVEEAARQYVVNQRMTTINI